VGDGTPGSSLENLVVKKLIDFVVNFNFQSFKKFTEVERIQVIQGLFP
jgi:hypothetical protein